MNGVKEWSAAVCMAVLAAAMLQNLVPNGSMERMVKFVIGAFVICAMIQPLAKAIPEIKWNVQENSGVQENARLKQTVNNQLSDAAQQSIRNLVITELRNIDIKCENVTAIMDTHEDGSISINKVQVVLAKGYGGSCAAAAEHLEKVLGLKMEVTADERNG